MKIEDFVCADSEPRSWTRPLPRLHAIAVAITLTATAALAVVAQIKYHNIDSDQETIQGNLAANPNTQLGPTSVPLADLFAEKGPDIPANNNQVSNQPQVATVQDPKLENYDDDLPAGTLEDEDAELDKQVRQLAQSVDKDKPEDEKWFSEDVHAGDTLSSVFSDLNIPYNVMLAIASNREGGADLTDMKPGESLYFLLDDDNKLESFVKQISKTEQIRFYRPDDSKMEFKAVREKLGAHLQDIDTDIKIAAANTQKDKAEVKVKQPDKNEKAAATDTKKTQIAAESKAKSADKDKDVKVAAAKPEPKLPAYKTRGNLVVVTIKKGQSFSSAAYNGGLTYSEINRVIGLFKGRIQFTRHLHPGDTMRVLFSDRAGKGRINAVEFNLASLGKVSVFRNSDGKYYDEKGMNSSKGSFRRFPLASRIKISSPFNPRRRHPVLGILRPHYGTDFSARVGTPVIAPADGVVVKSGYNRSAGYFLMLRHRGAYSTVYMHLSRILVKPGQRVKMGSQVARTGNTGLSTGPHLHYELRINGRPVNAMRVKLNNYDDAVGRRQRLAFASNVKKYKRQLHQASLVAANK